MAKGMDFQCRIGHWQRGSKINIHQYQCIYMYTYKHIWLISVHVLTPEVRTKQVC